MKHVLLPLLAALLLLLLVLQLRPSNDPDPSPYVPHHDLEVVDERTNRIAASVDASADADDPGEDLRRLELSAVAERKSPESATATVRVLVRRHDGRPLPFVEVVVGPPIAVDARLDDRTAISDSDGAATFVLSEGKWKARTNLGGSAEFALHGGGTADVVLELPGSPAVRGFVRDDRGAPVANAQVLVLSSGAAGIARQGAESGPDGQFELPGVGSGRMLAARKNGFAPSVPRRVELADPKSPTVVLVLSREHGFVTGSVLQSDGRPVRGAVVWFGPVGLSSSSIASSPPAQVVPCDADGRFESPPLVPGAVEVRATARGFALSRTTTTVQAGASSDVVLRLTSGARVRGIVRRPDGTPVRDAIVYSGIRRAMGSRLAPTAEDGSYVLEQVPLHAVELTAMALAENETLQFARTTVTPGPGDELVWDPRLQPEARGAVRGRIETETGQALAGWTVRAVPNGQRSGLFRETATDGSFSFTGLPPGSRVELTALSPLSGVHGFADGVLPDVEVDGPPVRIEIRHPATDRGTLLGTVVDDDGRPVAADLHLRHARGSLAHYATRLDGSFRVEGVPSGELQIAVRHEDFPTLSLPSQNVLAGGILDLGTLQLRRGGLAYGRLLDADDQPIATATMRLLDDTETEIRVSDCAGGGYRTPWLEAGQYVLLVQAEGSAPSRVPLRIDAGQQREVDVRLRPGNLHRLRVVTRDPDDGEHQCSVIVFDAQKRAIWVAHLPMSHGTAEFRAWLPPGELTAVALGVRGARADTTFATVDSAHGGPALTELGLER